MNRHIKKEKITLAKFWNKLQESRSWNLSLSCAEKQNLMSSLRVPVQCQMSVGSACWRKEWETFGHAAISNKCQAAAYILKDE